ncbi:MAG TPA: threonine--tRNA ligase [Firmicutes bacterium]|nr:threonine--tRNA ligase [Bacillota bacterium]
MPEAAEQEVQVTLPDGAVRGFPRGTTLAKVAQTLSPRLGREAVAAVVEGSGAVDLSFPLAEAVKVRFLTLEEQEGVEVLRHSAAHLLAEAVLHLYPGAKLGIGPAIEHGFYYDFDLPVSLTPEALAAIESEMRRLAGEKQVFAREEVAAAEALALFRRLEQPYKVELIEDLVKQGAERVSLYRQGDFVDLCRGPHLPDTGRIKAFKLTSVAGAYWRGDSSRPMLQRIYGVAFAKQSELDAHLHMLEEAAKRDHRKLGRELDLFSIQEEGPGFPFFHPKGMVLRSVLEDFWRKLHRKRGYQEIRTPIILNEELWHRSGHWDHYRENMYFTVIDGQNYAVKPMNCPGAILLYRRSIHSYRDLPLRLAELGLVHRHELSGVLHGLMRVRCFTQDDAHLFMTPDQIQREIEGVIDLTDYVYRLFGFEYHVELSTRPEKAMGSDELWQKAEAALAQALEAKGLPYKINPGDGAFYGPKIDFHLRDCLGRTWQCGTIQLDFQMPERFDLTYVGEDGQKHRPVMVHRVVFGSIERFIGILIEHFAGAFPLWLAPVQIKVLPVTPAAVDYAAQVAAELEEAGLRAEVDGRNEKIGYRIREAQLEKVPYMLVVGEKEAAAQTVAVRTRTGGDQGTMPLAGFIRQVVEEDRSRSLEGTVCPA